MDPTGDISNRFGSQPCQSVISLKESRQRIKSNSLLLSKWTGTDTWRLVSQIGLGLTLVAKRVTGPASSQWVRPPRIAWMSKLTFTTFTVLYCVAFIYGQVSRCNISYSYRLYLLLDHRYSIIPSHFIHTIIMPKSYPCDTNYHHIM